jgi:two-component system sensor histidine kinase ChvG
VAIIRDDVGRLDRLITDISEASRMDAQLSRARFETIDVGTMIEQLVAGRDERGVGNEVRLAFARPNRGSALIFGDGHRLARAIENLVDNAISFSPPGGLVQVAATRDRDEIVVRVEDDGPVFPNMRARRSSTASIRSAPKERNSAAIPASASPSPRRSSRGMAAAST